MASNPHLQRLRLHLKLYTIYTFDYYECRTCGNKIGDGHKGYLAPTEAAISIIYILK